MTTHTDLIARLREFGPCIAQDVQDALESLEQQVAALTKERDELEISNAFAHGEWRAVKDQLAAMTKEKNDWYRYHGHVTDELVISQAREAKLRELWEVVEKEYFARLKEQDEEAAKFEAEKDMYGWNFHKGLRGGLVEFHIYMTKIVKALALPTDDSALMERNEAIYQTKVATQEHFDMEQELAAALAREAKLRDAAKAVLEVGMGSDFEALNAAFALPTDDSTLQERLKQEREKCADAMWQAYLDGEESYSKLHDVIRSMT